jgi:hypothetical protein
MIMLKARLIGILQTITFLGVGVALATVLSGQVVVTPPSSGGGGGGGLSYPDLAVPPPATALGATDTPYVRLVVTGLVAPTVTLIPTPSGGATGYEYYVIAVLADGSTTGTDLAQVFGFITNGPATLDVTHYVDISWNAIAGAVSYRVYTDERDGTPSSLGLLATVAAPTLTYRDTGAVADGNVVYPSNTTGSAVLPIDLTVSSGRADGWHVAGVAGARFLSLGLNSTLIGDQVGPSVVTDTLDILAVGSGALAHLGDGSGGHSFNDVAIGRQALAELTTGDYNLGIGNSVLASLLTGDYNLAIGADAGNYSGAGIEPTTTGSRNIFIGAEAGFTSGSSQLDNTLVIGYRVRVSASNRAVIGDASMADVYFGSETPAAAIHAADVTATAQAGTGTEFACFNNAGKLVRSGTACGS